MSRLLSFSEIETALTCLARWDFAYGGRLAGSTLKARELAPVLSEGRAWGAAVAAWHTNQSLLAHHAAHLALIESLDADELAMVEAGFPPSLDARIETEAKLAAMLDHYIVTSAPIPNLARLEHHGVVPIPSRGGVRSSSRFKFEFFLDALADEDGRPWIVEFKLRNRLKSAELIMRQRQPRWYAWGFQKLTGITPRGVILEERLNEAPKPARTVKGRRRDQDRVPSHAQDQMTTPEAYIELCLEYGDTPKPEVVETLRSRIWQHRVPILLTPEDLQQAGEEIRDAAKLIRGLDAGDIVPIRNAGMACGYCRFREICSDPDDEFLVESLFERTVPKRLRERQEI